MIMRLKPGLCLILSALFTGIPVLQGVSLHNQYIEVRVNDLNQRIDAFSTKGGNPDLASDDNHQILHQKTLSYNYASINVDGEVLKIGYNGKSVSAPVVTAATQIRSQWELKSMLLEQVIDIVPGDSSHLPDSLRITYFVKNQDTVPHNVGIRLLFDTFIGPEDSGPFLVPLSGVVMMEKKTSNCPDFFIGLDSLLEPYIQFQATLKGPGLSPPDVLVFANAEKLNNSPWDMDIEKKSFRNPDTGLSDTAYALYWDPIAFPEESDPKSKKKLSTKIGLYGSTITAGEAIDLSIGGPLNIRNKPFTVVALVQNHDKFRTVKNASVSMDLPEGSVITSKIKDHFFIPELKPGDIKFMYYTADPSEIGSGSQKIRLKVQGEFNNSMTVTASTRQIIKE
jgi:hypothetical protein